MYELVQWGKLINIIFRLIILYYLTSFVKIGSIAIIVGEIRHHGLKDALVERRSRGIVEVSLAGFHAMPSYHGYAKNWLDIIEMHDILQMVLTLLNQSVERPTRDPA